MEWWYCWWLKSGDHRLRLVVGIPLFTRFYASQVVVWDFVQQQYIIYLEPNWCLMASVCIFVDVGFIGMVHLPTWMVGCLLVHQFSMVRGLSSSERNRVFCKWWQQRLPGHIIYGLLEILLQKSTLLEEVPLPMSLFQRLKFYIEQFKHHAATNLWCRRPLWEL